MTTAGLSPAKPPTRWDRLQADLAAAGITARVDARPYPGGTTRSITIQAATVLVCVHDTWWRSNDAVWTGWEVYTEGRADSLVKRTWPRTKNRSQAVAAVRDALAP